jgi:photosystem II stability/assembly factor-like uncharacterized protein
MRKIDCSLMVVCGVSAIGSCGSDADDAMAHVDAANDQLVDATTRDVEDAGEARDAVFDSSAMPEGSLGPDSSAGADGTRSCSAWASWTDGLSGGGISAVQFDPRLPGTAFAVGAGRPYRTQDSGQSWSPLGEGPLVLERLAFPLGSSTTLLAVGKDGLSRSIDSGKTWSVTSLSGVAMSTLLIHPAAPQRLFVGGDQGFIMRSTDSGTTWRSVTAGVPFGLVVGFAADPTNADIVIAALTLESATGEWNGDGAIIRSTNGGTTWTIVKSDLKRVTDMTQCPANPNYVYASTVAGLARSTDAGITWSVDALSNSVLNTLAVAGPDCKQIYVSVFGAGVRRSTDAGVNWTAPLISGMTLQPSFSYPERLAVDPTNANNVLAGTHDGLFRSTSGGDSWTQAAGIQNVGVADINVAPTDPGHLWLASWGSGVWHRPDPMSAWRRVPLTVLPRDWAFTAYPDPVVADRVFVGAWLGGGDAWRSVDNSASFGLPLTSVLNPFVFATDPSNADIVYMGTQLGSVQKSFNGGLTWTPANLGVESAAVMSLLIDPANPMLVYIGTETNGIYQSRDAGASWTAVSGGPTSGRVASLVKANLGVANVLAWVDGAGVYRSTDGQTWTQANTGLTSTNAGGMVYDSETATAFVDTGAGIYQSRDGASWIAFDGGCPPPVSGGRPVVVRSGGRRWLVVNGGTATVGIVAHLL